MDTQFNNKINIILDTNFLIIPSSLSIDVLSEFDRLFGVNSYEIMIFDKTEFELEKLQKSYTGKELRQVKFAMVFLSFLKKSKDLKIIPSKGSNYIDDIIVKFIKETRPDNNIFYVATVDKDLSLRLVELGAKVISVRKKKFLFIR